MINETDKEALEMRRIRRMMRQLYALAEQASLTGAFPSGSIEAADRYNGVLTYLVDRNAVSPVLFAPLTGEMSWDRVAVSCKLLEGYLAEDAAARPREAGNLNFSLDVEDIDKLKDLGRTIRENLPEFIKRKMNDAAPAGPPPPPVS